MSTPLHLHIGMRKLKSLLAIVVGFLIWQMLRLFFPDLEAHPLFIYIYGFLEVRDTSEKTKTFGMQRIKATAVALTIGLPILPLRIWIHSGLDYGSVIALLDLVLILVGALAVLQLAERIRCGAMTGLAVAIYIILFLYHADDTRWLYSVLRALQTVIGVLVAWLVNVVLFPYPGKKE